MHLLFQYNFIQYSFGWPIHELPNGNADFRASIHWTNNYPFIEREQWVLIFWKSQLMKHFYSVYVLPPLSNVYGKIFSVGELIASGYASFMNAGTGGTATLRDFTALFHPGPRTWSSVKNSFTVFPSFDSEGCRYSKI
jgi:hypothetical protein